MTDINLSEELASRIVCVPLQGKKPLRFVKTPGVLWDELECGELAQGQSVQFFFRSGRSSDVPAAAGTRKEDGTLEWPRRFDALGLDVLLPPVSAEDRFELRFVVGESCYRTPVHLMRQGINLDWSDNFAAPMHIPPLQFFAVFLDYNGRDAARPGKYRVRLRGINYVPIEGTIPQGEGTHL